MYNDGGSQYLVNIGIGQPAQNFTVALDTGSSDLWVPLQGCPVNECPLDRFNPGLSDTFRSWPGRFHVRYGLGSVEGDYGQDSVYLQEAHVPDQVFGMASGSQDILFASDGSPQANGILGLGYPSLASDGQTPFLVRLYQSRQIERPLFGIYLSSKPGWEGGEITLGGVNKARYRGPIRYVPVHKDKAYWQVALDAIQLEEPDGRLWHQPFDSPRGLILDTGTTLTYLDPVLFHRILERLSFDLVAHKDLYLAPCALLQQATQRLSFVLQGVTLSVTLASLAIPLKDQMCLLGIAPWMASQPSQRMKEQGWILLGDSVLKSMYLVFDMEDHKVGFAQPNHHSK